MKLDLPSDSKGFAKKILGNSDSIFVLLAIYFAFVIIRFAVSLLFQYPLNPRDEGYYKVMAHSYFLSGSFYNVAALGHPGVTAPNVLYQLLISPCFWFGQNFFAVIKLINSLLMNSAIFPIYLLAREFLNKKDALIICVVVLTLPFFNFINVVMVEALVFPIFMMCFYLAFKTFTTMRAQYALLTGVFLVISFFVKTTALVSVAAIGLSFFLLMIFGFKLRFSGKGRSAVVCIALILCFGSISYLLLQRFFIGSDYFNTEMVNRFKGLLSLSTPPSELIQMGLAHLDTVLLTYFIPFCVIILALVVEGRNRFSKEMDKNLIFAVMLFSFFFLYLLTVLKYSFYHYHHEFYPFERLHARYYFMVLPLFIIGFAIFLPWLKMGIRERITLLVAGVIVILSGVTFFLPKYVSLGITIVDNPDLAWYSPPNKFLIIPFSLIFISTLLYYVMSARPSRSAFLWFLLCYSLIGNFGVVRASISYDSSNFATFKPYLDFIDWQLPKRDSKVAIIDSSDWYQFMLAFWKPFNFVGDSRSAKGAKIEKQSIPSDADYLILFDEHELDFPVRSAVTRGQCKIISLNNSGDTFKKGLPYQFGHTLKFTEGGNYIEYIGAGWGGPEKGYVWSDGSIAHMQITVASSSDSDLALRVNCTPFVVRPNHTNQRVRVLAGGTECCNWTISSKGEHECLIPSSAIKDSVLDLTFEFPDAASPKDYDLSNDSRKLGVAFHSAIITKAVQRYQPTGSINSP